MFQGTSEQTIDAKGRIVIPSKFRDFISEDNKLVITRLISKSCHFLVSFKEKDWELQREKWKNCENTLSSDVKDYLKDIVIAGADFCPIDKQSKVLIPPSLRNHSKLEKDIILIGSEDRFFIYAKSIWDEKLTKIAQAIEKPETKEEISTMLGL